ncbi:MAG: N-(5'-phosphoribosyl)anthranilate isomerase [Calditrichaeota bacterium]|nr:N-(5'-phosphoribosyl)anthranilate isomerase [Calditrichota bacterium]
MSRLLVKICCMQSAEEARLALALGADYIGLVSAMPSGPGPIPETRIREIIDSLPDRAPATLLTSLDSPGEIAAQQRRLGAPRLQLCAPMEPGAVALLRRRLPGVRLVPVVHVTGRDVIDHALAVAEQSDALTLDSGSPDARVPVLGGTGATHDWSVSREIARRSPVPVFLAGGLTADNVARAVEAVEPDGVDVCSGVRAHGLLARDKLESFLAALPDRDPRG